MMGAERKSMLISEDERNRPPIMKRTVLVPKCRQGGSGHKVRLSRADARWRSLITSHR
jgi:hypothetical protein